MRRVLALVALAAVDIITGTVLVVWPGLWQEIAHPLAMGTVFYPVQRYGALALGRAALAGWAARRPTPTRLAALSGAWLLEVPGALLLAWRTAHTGPFAALLYGGLAIGGLVVGIALWRAAQRAEDEGRHE